MKPEGLDPPLPFDIEAGRVVPGMELPDGVPERKNARVQYYKEDGLGVRRQGWLPWMRQSVRARLQQTL